VCGPLGQQGSRTELLFHFAIKMRTKLQASSDETVQFGTARSRTAPQLKLSLDCKLELEFFKIPLRNLYHKDRWCGAVQDLAGSAAKEGLADHGMAMGPHDDHIS
jgi:hypothetical protein